MKYGKVVDNLHSVLYVYDTMKISLQKKYPLGIRDQVKRQIRTLIDTGELKEGQALPSARNLSALLNVNRNTITQAYKELSVDGVLKVVIGSGTFVKAGTVGSAGAAFENKAALKQVFDGAIHSAKQLGFSTDEITECFFNCLSSLAADRPEKNILVVDCNDEVVSYLCRIISDEFEVRTQGVLIQEIEADHEGGVALFEGIDMVVCGLNHLEELKAAVPDLNGPDLNVKVVAVMLQVDAWVINTLAQLPEGTIVGCVCANQRSTETLYNSAYFSSGKALRRILAGYENSTKLKKVIRECDVIFATNFVFDRIRELVGPDQKLINVNLTVDSSSLALIRESIYC